MKFLSSIVSNIMVNDFVMAILFLILKNRLFFFCNNLKIEKRLKFASIVNNLIVF